MRHACIHWTSSQERGWQFWASRICSVGKKLFHTHYWCWDNERMLHFLFSSFVVNIWLQTKYFSIYFFFIKFLSAVDLTKSQTCLCFFQGKSLILVIVNMVSPELLRWQLRDGCLIHEKQTPEITTLFGSHVGRTEATQNKISEYRLLTEGRLLFITITMHH